MHINLVKNYNNKESIHWKNENFPNYYKLLNKLHDELYVVRSNIDHINNTELVSKERDIQQQIEQAMAQETIYWKTKTKISWDKFGDLNSKYFQEKVNYRRRHNKIDALFNQQLGWTSNPNDISQRLVN